MLDIMNGWCPMSSEIFTMEIKVLRHVGSLESVRPDVPAIMLKNSLENSKGRHHPGAGKLTH